jgi:antitoxin (DNA-binding transcriptional repressor) of toxin-antitoxin stability system
MMKTLGIRQAKAHLSQLVRAAAQGECSLITDNRKPVAMIGPPPQDPVEAEEAKAPSDAAEFRKALLGVPSPIEFNF